MGLFLFLLFCNAAFAQDERRVVSPDGELEFHLFVNGQPDSNLSRVAYQIRVHGKVLIDTSYLGFDLYEQEPLLGENVGLMSESHTNTAEYHSLIAHYMQNGSLGRRLDVEARVYNSAVAFRCRILKSTGVERLTIADEATEFDLPRDPKASLTMPFFAEQKGIGWVAITEVPVAGYPPMTLTSEDRGSVLLSRLVRKPVVPDVVFDGKPPLTCPWRVILIGPNKERLLQSAVLKALDDSNTRPF